MMAPFAPVQAGLAYRPARMGEGFSRYLQAALHESLALGGEFDRLLAVAHQPLPFHAVEHLHAKIARQMIIADPRAAQRRVLPAPPHPPLTPPFPKPPNPPAPPPHIPTR